MDWFCRVCLERFPSPQELAGHFVTKGHKDVFFRFSHVALKEFLELFKLKQFLDTYMKEEPVLGLECMVEERESPISYKYTCQLCNVKGNLYVAVLHITDCEHTARYIDSRYRLLAISADQYQKRSHYVKDLRARALMIQNTFGRRSVMQKLEDLIALNRSPNCQLKSKMPHAKEKSSLFLHDGHGVRLSHSCDLCKIVYVKPVELLIHIVGKKHKRRRKVLGASPEPGEGEGPLQYFLDNYMKEYPLVGLEYIVEEQLNSISYMYTCQLCDAKGHDTFMLDHITFVDHVERYIEKHHKDLSLKMYSYHRRFKYIEALTAVAFTINKEYGCQKIRVKGRDVTDHPQPQ